MGIGHQLNEKIQELDQLTRQGKRNQVLAELKKLPRKDIPVDLLPIFARIANRNSAYFLAMYFLFSEIQKDREGLKVASADAYAVFANSLLNIGALEEASECILKAGFSAEAYLICSFINMAKWDYGEALAHLKKYISSSTLTDYQRRVGSLNIAATLVSLGKLAEARVALSDLIKNISDDPASRLLLGNCFELLSQVAIHERNFGEAEMTLRTAHEVLNEFPGRYLLYVKKWESILEVAKNPHSPDARKKILDVKYEAASLRNWETIRDCDFHFARLTDDQELLKRVYFGTPYRGYRDRIKSLFDIKEPDVSKISFVPGTVFQSPTRVAWDLDNKMFLKGCGSSLWQLLQCLVKDIYRPPRMGLVFSTLYKGEKFNPFSSPQRVRSSVFRFNQWAQTRPDPFQIVIEKGDFFLRGKAGLGISYQVRKRAPGTDRLLMQAFRKAFGSRSFSSREVADILQISKRSASLLIKRHLERNLISKMGLGPSTRYIFSSHRGRTKGID